MRSASRNILALALIATPIAGPAAAQSAGLDLTFASRDVWRGLIRTSKPVLQADAFGATPRLRGVRLTGGGWVSWEGFGVAGDGLSSCPSSSSCLGEKRLWAELDARLGSAFWFAGWIGYFDRRFPTSDGLSLLNQRNTHEIFTSLWLPRVYLAPRLSGYFDVDEVGGGYLEASVALPVLGNINARPFWALFLTAETGYSFGQTFESARPGNIFYYESGRSTHVDLGVGSDLPFTPWPWLSSSASLHARIAADERSAFNSRKPDSGGRWVLVYARVTLSAPRWTARR